MSVRVMVILTAIVVLLPLVLMFAFNRTDEADSRGRRISRRWRVRTRNSPPALREDPPPP